MSELNIYFKLTFLYFRTKKKAQLYIEPFSSYTSIFTQVVCYV